MAKPNLLFDHLMNPAFRDERSRIAIIPDSERLRYGHFGERGNWHTAADFISGIKRWPVTWFPDANVAFLDPAAPVWRALREIALTVSGGRTVLTGVIEAEMRQWLDDPFRNKERAADIKCALNEGTWIKSFKIDGLHPMKAALYGYTQLIGFRRILALPVADGTTLLGTHAADKSATMNAIRNRLGVRAQGLAKKGRDDAAAKGATNISDEMHCVMTILYALIHRENSMILTADADYLEIFYKAQWFIDMHYRAWLASKLIRQGRYGAPAGVIEETQGCFKGPLILYRRHTGQMHEVLPRTARAVRAGVLYVAPNGTLQKSSFPFELQMLDMLKTRSETEGRCTDISEEMNVHIDLGPLTRGLGGLYLGIGKDATIEFEKDGIKSNLSRLDLEHSIHCLERFAA